MSFDSLIGNDDAKQLLRRLAEKRRVPHALLFSGPDGVGKKLFAFELARLMLCKQHGCGTCAICSRIGIFDIPKPEKGDDFDTVFLSDHPEERSVFHYLQYTRHLLRSFIPTLEFGSINRWPNYPRMCHFRQAQVLHIYAFAPDDLFQVRMGNRLADPLILVFGLWAVGLCLCTRATRVKASAGPEPRA